VVMLAAAVAAVAWRGAISVDGVRQIYLTCCTSEYVVVVFSENVGLLASWKRALDDHNEMVGKESRCTRWVRGPR
jgi:hypothetical protein